MRNSSKILAALIFSVFVAGWNAAMYVAGGWPMSLIFVIVMAVLAAWEMMMYRRALRYEINDQQSTQEGEAG